MIKISSKSLISYMSMIIVAISLLFYFRDTMHSLFFQRKFYLGVPLLHYKEIIQEKTHELSTEMSFQQKYLHQFNHNYNNELWKKYTNQYHLSYPKDDKYYAMLMNTNKADISAIQKMFPVRSGYIYVIGPFTNINSVKNLLTNHDFYVFKEKKQ